MVRLVDNVLMRARSVDCGKGVNQQGISKLEYAERSHVWPDRAAQQGRLCLQ